jgi:hypothetical protein
MRGQAILYFFILLFFSLYSGNAQQVNPFELRTGTDTQVNKKDSTSNIDTGNFNITVIEDSLSKPVITEDVEIPEFSVPPVEEPTAISETQEVNEVDENRNPFALINGTDNDEGIQQDTANTLEIIDTSAISIDSLGIDQELGVPVESESIINKKKPEIPKSRNLIVLWASLFSGLLIALSINSKRNLIVEIWKSFRNLSYMKLLQKEQKNGWSIQYILFYVVFLINISIFIRFLCIHFKLPLLGYSYIKILIFVFAIIAIRHLCIYVISFMRKKLNEIIQYNFIIISTHIFTGLVLIPVNLCLAFASPKIALFMLYAGLSFVTIAYLSRCFRAFMNSLRIVLSHSFHFLLYLCSCEIVPILILIGYLRNLIA